MEHLDQNPKVIKKKPFAEYGYHCTSCIILYEDIMWKVNLLCLCKNYKLLPVSKHFFIFLNVCIYAATYTEMLSYHWKFLVKAPAGVMQKILQDLRDFKQSEARPSIPHLHVSRSSRSS